MKPVTLCSLAIGTLAVGGLGGDAASAKPPQPSVQIELTKPLPVGRVKLQKRTVELSVQSLAAGGAAHSVADGVAVRADAEVVKRATESLDPHERAHLSR
jgi:hypothetical protein